jgi:hypothetical protein
VRIIKTQEEPQVRSNSPQNCGNTRLLDEKSDYEHAAVLSDEAINLGSKLYGSVNSAISSISREYKIKPAWLTRLRERRHVPVYRHAFHNLCVAIDDLQARVDAAREREIAKIKSIKQTGAQIAAALEDRSAGLERH